MSPVPSPAVLRALAEVPVAPHEVIECVPLAGGTYNSVVRVVLRDGRRWVVKVAPATGPQSALGYELDLLRGERTYFRAAADGVPGAPVPHVVRAETAGDPPVVRSLVMTECPGRPWHDADQTLEPDERRRLRRELGALTARLHAVTGPVFGYPARPFGPPHPTWRQTFTAMTDAVLHDATRFGARLPQPVPTVRRILASAGAALDDVTRPALVHFDLWQGNILLAGAPGARVVAGVVDGERMFWGDPVAEFVSLALFDDIEHDDAFLDGYSAAGGEAGFTDSVRLRLDLYRCYLCLIMLVEGTPRGYSREQRTWVWKHAGGHLAKALHAVSAAVAGTP
ncbi:phosphotransferase family protein [Streptomyces sp. NPDC017890]|uniref:phosphotransferase family protein n=1 Tax=Streptomyces sp. NPDC017890 TaxID=3365015 RepID=UPI0037B3605D